MPLKVELEEQVGELEERLAEANRRNAKLTAQLQQRTLTLSHTQALCTSLRSDAAQLRERSKSLATASVDPDFFLAIDSEGSERVGITRQLIEANGSEKLRALVAGTDADGETVVRLPCDVEVTTVQMFVHILCFGTDAPDISIDLACELIQLGHALDVRPAMRHAADNLMRVGEKDLDRFVSPATWFPVFATSVAMTNPEWRAFRKFAKRVMLPNNIPFEVTKHHSLRDVQNLKVDVLRSVFDVFPADQLVDTEGAHTVRLKFSNRRTKVKSPSFGFGFDANGRQLTWRIRARKDESNIGLFLALETSSMTIFADYKLGLADEILFDGRSHFGEELSASWGTSELISVATATERGILNADGTVSAVVKLKLPRHSTQLKMLTAWCKAHSAFMPEHATSDVGTAEGQLCTLLRFCEVECPRRFDDILLFHAAGNFAALARSTGFTAFPTELLERIVVRSDLTPVPGGDVIDEKDLVELLAPWMATHPAVDVSRILARLELREISPEHLRAFVSTGGCLQAFKDDGCVADVLAAAIDARLRSKRAADNEPPDWVMCPISHELMVDPVICVDGHTCVDDRGGLNNVTESSARMLLIRLASFNSCCPPPPCATPTLRNSQVRARGDREMVSEQRHVAQDRLALVLEGSDP